VCNRMCQVGCYCPAGQVRGEAGTCVQLEECPTEAPPEPPTEQCPPGEEYNTCGGCQGTCSEPNPVCNRMCQVGCYCPAGQVRGEAGTCVQLEECPTEAPQCGQHQEYKECGTSCEPSCQTPEPDMCTEDCVQGCFCADTVGGKKRYRAPDGSCQRKWWCKKHVANHGF